MKDNEILIKTVCNIADQEKINIFKNTGVGVVEERGLQVREVNVDDKVVWAGIPVANKIVVPEYLFDRVPLGLKDEIAVFGGVGAFIIQAVRESNLTFGENAIVLGNGILKKIVSQIITLFGIQNLDLEYAYKSDVLIDGIFVCPNGEKYINLVKNFLRDESFIIVLTENDVDFYSNLLLNSNQRIILPTYPKLKENNIYYPESYIRWTFKEDIRLFLKLLKTGRVNLL